MTRISLSLLATAILSSCGPEIDEGTGDEVEEPPTTKVDVTEPAVTAVSAEKANELIGEKADLVVLDVRTPEEFAEGHIKGAINIDVKGDEFDAQIAKLNPEVPYVIHCRSGSRSATALQRIESLKFGTIYHLDSGFLGWQEAGLPVEK